MKAKLAFGLALSLACISAAESPANYQTYSGLRIEGNVTVQASYRSALRTCIPEAATPPQGDPNSHSLRYNAALRLVFTATASSTAASMPILRI